MTPADLAKIMLQIALAQRAMEHRALDKVGRLVKKTAKKKLGEYQEQAGPFVKWAELADSTKADRVRLGFSENDPLLRTGDLRDSIEHMVDESEVQIGSNSDIAVYQELGTSHIPPRSFLGGAVADEIPAILDILGDDAVAGLIGNSVVGGRLSIKN